MTNANSPTDFSRMPPQDTEAERATLAGMILANKVVPNVTDVVKPSDFYLPAHALIFTTITDFYGQGHPADTITLTNHFRTTGDLNRIGGPAYISALPDAAPSAANAEHYAQIVADKSVLRRMTEAGRTIMELGYHGEGDPDELISQAEATFHTVSDQEAQTGYAFIGDRMEEALDTIEQAGSTKGQMIGIPTGIKDLDNLTQGLRPGQMIVIAARPGAGKSTLALNLSRSCSIRNGLPSVFFSLEMSSNELIEKVLSAETGILLRKIRNGDMDDDAWARLARTMPDISTAPLIIDDSPDLTMSKIRTRCREIKQKHGLGMIVIDYLQLMQSGGRAESRQQEVSDMSRSIKLLAKELEVPIIALSQLNRGPEQRHDKRPTISDLRESGSIEQDADMVLLIHREDMYQPDGPRAGEADIIIGKNRGGPTPEITVGFQGHYSRFVDMAAEYPTNNH